ncbi:hypothetical protein CU669_15370 [Paramagnetospirillum kuznetsovii]|uniref:Hydrogenase maturation protease n=1 Tax=Paramagnetospirillum kuznetsovii TaxID=2053833 RepID=A0A364NVE3_9PROT|nr:hydrogenase maturation protease [Paramagnetospirillum kuznetsovii]RAU20970.1 hypothetical protein CU669_15370 [Paramagnetospirillum kuznetsovii]
MSRALVIGIGVSSNGDDGAGPAVAANMRRIGLDVLVHDGQGGDLSGLWLDYDRVVLISATHSGTPAGTVRVFDGIAADLPEAAFPKSMAPDLVADLAKARKAGRLPKLLALVGIESGGRSGGELMSPEVEAAVPLAMAEVERFL